MLKGRKESGERWEREKGEEKGKLKEETEVGKDDRQGWVGWDGVVRGQVTLAP